MTAPYMAQNNSPADGSAARRRADGRKHPRGRPTVLVADDDGDVRLMMRTLLEMKGYRVVEAADGQAALAVAQAERPDAILLDLQLPRLNGFAVTRQVRQTDGLRHVPVVVITGHDPSKHLNLALAAGCNAYILKPVNFGRLEELLAGLMAD